MKKLFLATLFTSATLAATTATLNLSGTINSVVEIEIDGGSSVTKTVDLLDKAPQSVATVTETSNDVDGYDITITSTNSGSLNNGSDDSAAYTLSYAGTSYNLSTAQTVENPSVVGTNDRAVAVTITDARTNEYDFVDGTYSDVVTFEITAK